MTDRTRPHRPTRHRDEVSALLRDTTEFLSAQRVHALLRGHGSSIGLTTVYRILQSLAEDGTADCVRTASGEHAYRRCSPVHHHHLMCRSCGRTVEIQGPVIEQWADAIAEVHGFRDVNHRIEIFGTCPACAAGRTVANATS